MAKSWDPLSTSKIIWTHLLRQGKTGAKFNDKIEIKTKHEEKN